LVYALTNKNVLPGLIDRTNLMKNFAVCSRQFAVGGQQFAG